MWKRPATPPDEVLSAANALAAAKVDAVFTPTDNTIMNSAAAVGEIFAEAGIPHYTGADSFVTAGCFATCGVNYTDLGTYTADMALEILQGGAVPTFHVMERRHHHRQQGDGPEAEHRPVGLLQPRRSGR